MASGACLRQAASPREAFCVWPLATRRSISSLRAGSFGQLPGRLFPGSWPATAAMIAWARSRSMRKPFTRVVRGAGMAGRVSKFAAGSEQELRVRKVGLPIDAVFPKGLGSPSAMEEEQPLPSRRFSERRSASACKSHEEQVRRLRRMSIEERIHMALGMKERFSWLKLGGVPWK